MTLPIGSARPDLGGAMRREDLVATLRRIFVDRVSGQLRVGEEGERRPLTFVDGDLFVDREHPLGPRIERILHSPESSEGSDWLLAGKAELRAVIAVLVDGLDLDGEVHCELDDPVSADPDRLLGPLPTYFLIMEAAVRGVGANELLRILGGEKARLVTAENRRMIKRLPTLDGPARQLVSRLAEPTSLRVLLRIKSGQRLALLQWLVRLAALGLISAERRDPSTRQPDERGLVPNDLLERFLQRIGQRIEEDPPEIPVEQQRSEVASLLGRIGGLTHYEVLGVEVHSSAEELAAAYDRLGKLVHPRNSTRLQFEGREGVLRMLFERVTQAYLVLSDPQRRKDYDLEFDIKPEAEARSEEEVQEIRREMARKNFERAEQYVEAGEFHYAVEHLRDAVRWDSRPEYCALLGEVMAKNPKWLPEAEDYLEQAVEGAGDEPRYRHELAKVYEQRGRKKEAIEQYETMLEHLPGHPEAVDALERLTYEESKDRRTPLGWLLRWLTGE